MKRWASRLIGLGDGPGRVPLPVLWLWLWLWMRVWLRIGIRHPTSLRCFGAWVCQVTDPDGVL
jgi:hypothetical protein